MRVRSSGLVPGLANAWPPGGANIANAPCLGLTSKAGKCPTVARGVVGGGGGGGWAQLELTVA